MHENLKNAVSPFVSVIYQQGGMALKPVSGIVPAHIESFGLSHSCSKTCLNNIPVQTCGNICGVAAAVLAGIACAAPWPWRNVFLNRNTVAETYCSLRLYKMLYHFLAFNRLNRSFYSWNNERAGGTPTARSRFPFPSPIPWQGDHFRRWSCGRKREKCQGQQRRITVRGFQF